MENFDDVFGKCSEGDFSAIQKYLRNGFPINSQNSEGNSLLHISTSSGFLHITEVLVNEGANIDLPNNYGWTPVMHAARCGYSEIVSFLVNKRAKINISNRFGLRAIDFAVWSGNIECLKLLIDAGAVIDNSGGQNDLCDLSPLMAASLQGHDSIIQILLEKGSSVNQSSPITGLTPLMLAACSGYLQIVKVLIKWGIDVNATSNCGQTALELAVACNHLDIKTYLESLTVPKFVITSDNVVKTNILLAVKNGNFDAVKSLLQLNPSQCNYFDVSVGLTPLMFASMHGHYHIIELLLANGADINAQDSADGWTPLMYAVFHRQADAVHILLDKGAKVDICSVNGYTALDLAIHIDSSETDIVEALLAHSAPEDVETQDFLAISSGSTLRRSQLSTEKASSRGDSPVRFKEWIGGLSSHLRSRSKSSTTCPPVAVQNLESSMSNVFLEDSSLGKPLEGNYISISKLYAPNQRFAQALKEQVVEAVVLPPLPSQPSYIDSVKRYSSRKNRSRNKNSKSFNSLQCPNLVRRHFERNKTVSKESSTVLDAKYRLEGSQDSTLKASSFKISPNLLVKRQESKESFSSCSSTKELNLSCSSDYQKDLAEKNSFHKNEQAFTNESESLADICKGSLRKYEEKFRDQEIDFETFKHLTEDDLSEIGVQSLESRSKFLEIIKQLKNS